jgi:bifunctional DNA-binding transcriptional regulator/antitoxin component of YhaV-PrlF toxin-antitoxin module
MQAATMTLTKKRQAVFPLAWCKRQGLEQGGPLNVFDLGDAGLLVRPVRPPTAGEIQRLLAQTPVGKHSAKRAAALVQRALRKTRGQ